MADSSRSSVRPHRTTFLPPEAFGRPSKYDLLPFRFHRLADRREVLVSDWGQWLVAPDGTARRLVRRELDPSANEYSELRARQFICDEASSPLLDLAATKLRTKKRHLEEFTSLHMFVVTLRCEHSCHYCQVSRQTTDRALFDMSRETASKSIDLVLRAPTLRPKVEFQGGEPLLAFDMIRYIVSSARERAARLGKEIDFVVATNLALVSDEMLSFFRDYRVAISTSLDGPAALHNKNRPRHGNDSYERAVDGIARARETLGRDQVSALMTTTQRSLDCPEEIIDEYVRLGFKSVFLRSISPYGFATRSQRTTGYETERFLDFYKRGLRHIIGLNRNGVDLVEVYAKIILTKLLTPFETGFVDLLSPSGAGISACLYNYDGFVYPSDEARMLAEMGNHSFRIGNVHANTYEEIFGGRALMDLVEVGIAETLPGCSDCALQPFCGAEPIFNEATQGDRISHRASSEFCAKNMSIIEYLIDLASTHDPELQRIIWAWIRDVGLQDISRETPA